MFPVFLFSDSVSLFLGRGGFQPAPIPTGFERAPSIRSSLTIQHCSITSPTIKKVASSFDSTLILTDIDGFWGKELRLKQHNFFASSKGGGDYSISFTMTYSHTWDSWPLPAYKLFENVDNFLKTVDGLGHPLFEASVFERDNLEAVHQL
ncbi:unnamed protein product [Lactuca virosa]|uniref:Uncharacterized protein n=1 Tax=Lactuca virosa TaxID=75947 RepID=A0AAU9MA74_9ASTR|nr:unnamed protein product [Lactuca virosa]